MLFLQGTRDALADVSLLKPVVKGLGKLATLHLTEAADHSFHVLKSSGRSDPEVMAEILTGLKAGETVVTTGAYGVEDGAKIERAAVTR